MGKGTIDNLPYQTPSLTLKPNELTSLELSGKIENLPEMLESLTSNNQML